MSRRPIARETSPPRSGARCLGLLVAGLLLIAAATVGCGESDEEKAQTQVCDARADLKKQVDELAGLTAGTATVDGVEANLNAIEDDLNQIKDARGDLNEDRRQEVESATQEFTSEVEAVAKRPHLGPRTQWRKGQAGDRRQAAGKLLPADLRGNRLRMMRRRVGCATRWRTTPAGTTGATRRTSARR